MACAVATNAAASDFKPAAIDFNQDLAEMRIMLQRRCESVEEREISPPQIPETKDKQIQIDCSGFAFEGEKRLDEFVFRDGDLMLVWVLTNASEEEMLEEKMRAAFGEPTYQGRTFIAFTRHQAALRTDTPEVLFYAPAAAAMFEEWFAQSQDVTQ